MSTPPQAFAPAQAILELGDAFYDPVAPADFPQAKLRFRNDRWAARVGLGDLDDAQWVRHFARFAPLPGTLPRPLALRYHGHQFRVYNPDIGDGRGFLYAQLRDDRGRLLDLGTKGSGQTPYSRFGDGRLTLKGGVREILATEMLEALGVETSKSFSLIETGEALDRGDEPSPTRSAVLVRLSHGHIRIGSFQRLAYHRDTDDLARLTDYVLRHYFDDASGDPVRLLDAVVARTARLAGQYMAAGFVHGVLNSDNINVTGESFDYGPWRFLPSWDPGFTAAYFDHAGLYAFGRQPEAIHWDVFQLAICLRLLVDSAPLIPIMESFAQRYAEAFRAALLWRLGVAPGADDAALVEAIEHGLATSQVDVASFFHQSFGGRIPDALGPAFAEARGLLLGYRPRTSRDAFWDGPVCAMLIEEVEALWAAIAERDDWGPFAAKITAIRAMGDALADA
ncbi:MAG: selenoprotein O [Proteobacteria bacterium SG_bin5]|nr:MAG: selenoprotein O [Proteobacteria bacterium SG_bin5]